MVIKMASKNIICDVCGGIIQKGDKFIYTSGYTELFEHKVCPQLVGWNKIQVKARK